jgi:hypothetical protein
VWDDGICSRLMLQKLHEQAVDGSPLNGLSLLGERIVEVLADLSSVFLRAYFGFGEGRRHRAVIRK